jgi:hypothetical protein
MIQMAVQVCRIDDRPIERSMAYKLIHLCCGQNVADKLTYEIVVPKVDDS